MQVWLVQMQMQMLATVPTKCMVLVLAVLCRCSGSGTAYQVLRVVLVRAHQVQVLVVQAGHQRRADWIVWMRPSLSFTRSM